MTYQIIDSLNGHNKVHFETTVLAQAFSIQRQLNHDDDSGMSRPRYLVGQA